MRIAVAGKGGAGKTTFSATLARTVARRGHEVLVIDADSNPNVAIALGIPSDAAAGIKALPASLVSRRLTGPGLNSPVGEVIETHGVRGPDRVAVVHMAMPQHADEGCLCSAHATVSAMLADMGEEREDLFTVMDLEASPEHFGRGTTRNVDRLFLVIEPYYRSLETARRMSELAAELPIAHVGAVANKVRSPGDADAIEAFCERHNLLLDAVLPWSDGALDADRAKVPLIDHDPADPFVLAVEELAASLMGRLTEREVQA